MKKSSTYMIIAVVLFFITLALSRSGSIATIIIGFGAMIMIEKTYDLKKTYIKRKNALYLE